MIDFSQGLKRFQTNNDYRGKCVGQSVFVQDRTNAE